jgi:hypothetical protein
MLKSYLSVMVSLFSAATLHAAGFAHEVISYNPGIGFAKEFTSGLGYTNSAAVLGEPSRITPGMFGGPVDPFNPPYLREQIVSMGVGGSLTVRFDRPIFNNPSNPFGVDFIIFGNAGFVITNGNFSGGGITDGSLFGANLGSTRVSVSQDNSTFFELNPSLTPTLDGLFPTDGFGNFSVPVNPKLSPASLAGSDLARLRTLYGGSGGGTGFDIDWARLANGQPARLESISAIRVEALSGVAEIDGFSNVSEPRLEENFASDPASRAWKTFGAGTLFRWNRTNQNLEVTWDSSKPNSFFYHTLNTVLGKDDDFAISFDLKLDEIAIGLRPSQPFTFQLAAGLLNFQSATNQTFTRGTGDQSPNLVEFNYFPDSGFGATVSPILVSSNNQFIPSFTFPLELTRGDLFHIAMTYSSTNQTLITQMTRNKEAFGPIKEVKLPASFTDFRVDTFAIMSYSDVKSDGSILARGVVDNISVQSPGPALKDLAGRFVNNLWQVEFTGRTNWVYTMERSADLKDWKPIMTSNGTGARQFVRDENAASPKAFYRVQAVRP